jgi:hypothetical protein
MEKKYEPPTGEWKTVKDWATDDRTQVSAEDIATREKLQEFCAEAEKCFAVIGQQIGKIGAMLRRADDELSGGNCKRFKRFLHDLGMKDADIEAAIAVDAGKLDEKLIFMGVSSQKILRLDKNDQERLLSQERFELMAEDHETIYQKTWGEMEDYERNQLISRSGRILAAEDQTPPDRDSTPEKIVLKPVGMQNKQLVFKAKSKLAQCSVVDILSRLRGNGQLDEFVEIVLTKQREWATKVA